MFSSICIRIHKLERGSLKKTKSKTPHVIGGKYSSFFVLTHCIFGTKPIEKNGLRIILYPEVKATVFHSPFSVKNISL